MLRFISVNNYYLSMLVKTLFYFFVCTFSLYIYASEKHVIQLSENPYLLNVKKNRFTFDTKNNQSIDILTAYNLALPEIKLFVPSNNLVGVSLDADIDYTGELENQSSFKTQFSSLSFDFYYSSHSVNIKEKSEQRITSDIYPADADFSLPVAIYNIASSQLEDRIQHAAPMKIFEKDSIFSLHPEKGREYTLKLPKIKTDHKSVSDFPEINYHPMPSTQPVINRVTLQDAKYIDVAVVFLAVASNIDLALSRQGLNECLSPLLRAVKKYGNISNKISLVSNEEEKGSLKALKGQLKRSLIRLGHDMDISSFTLWLESNAGSLSSKLYNARDVYMEPVFQDLDKVELSPYTLKEILRGIPKACGVYKRLGGFEASVLMPDKKKPLVDDFLTRVINEIVEKKQIASLVDNAEIYGIQANFQTINRFVSFNFNHYGHSEKTSCYKGIGKVSQTKENCTIKKFTYFVDIPPLVSALENENRNQDVVEYLFYLTRAFGMGLLDERKYMQLLTPNFLSEVAYEHYKSVKSRIFW